jgi:hypothetical protein
MFGTDAVPMSLTPEILLQLKAKKLLEHPLGRNIPFPLLLLLKKAMMK